MRSLRGTAALRNLRSQPLWKLLAADNAPIYVALLRSLLLESDTTLPSSVLLERLKVDIDQLQSTGETLALAPQAYVAEWLAQGWLTRRFPAGASEEEYELSADGLGAVRFITGLQKPKSSATESRLSTVIQQLSRLVEDTDTDPASRIHALRVERDRIDREIADVERHGVTPLAADRALERIREVIALADELAGDFRNVRDEFSRLNRGLRQSLLENEGSRGEVLEQLFAGVDVIGDSEAGRTFTAFWRLLTDAEQRERLFESLESVTSRDFARHLSADERRFLINLTTTLLNEGSGVHDVLQNFARSLKSFVQSREFLEQRRMHSLLKQATQEALAAKDLVRTNQSVGYSLTLSSSRIRSVSQWVLYDPAERVTDSTMAEAETSDLDLDLVSELVRQSEIDFRALKKNVLAMLDKQSQASVGEVLESFPAEQGLGSVVGYVALGAKHGELTQEKELVSWTGKDNQVRRARVPTIYFMRERYLDLVE